MAEKNDAEAIKLFELLQQFRNNREQKAINAIVEALIPDIYDIANEQNRNLPENYEVADLIDTAVVQLIEGIKVCQAETPTEFIEFCIETVETAVLQELAFIAGPPIQIFIKHQEAIELEKRKEKETEGGKEKNENRQP